MLFKQLVLRNLELTAVNKLILVCERIYEAKEIARMDRKKARGRLKICNLGPGPFDITAVTNP